MPVISRGCGGRCPPPAGGVQSPFPPPFITNRPPQPARHPACRPSPRMTDTASAAPHLSLAPPLRTDAPWLAPL
ncbi:hypothetical protein FVW27_17485, partial [Desulfovibrio sp. XJ01]|nr:hypothetical protein [Nitratidesulfovibrio liaohensis]